MERNQNKRKRKAEEEKCGEGKANTKPWLNYIKKSQSNKVELVLSIFRKKKCWRNIACNYIENMLLQVTFILHGEKNQVNVLQEDFCTCSS